MKITTTYNLGISKREKGEAHPDKTIREISKRKKGINGPT
jgi:hypothetical protein